MAQRMEKFMVVVYHRAIGAAERAGIRLMQAGFGQHISMA